MRPLSVYDTVELISVSIIDENTSQKQWQQLVLNMKEIIRNNSQFNINETVIDVNFHDKSCVLSIDNDTTSQAVGHIDVTPCNMINQKTDSNFINEIINETAANEHISIQTNNIEKKKRNVRTVKNDTMKKILSISSFEDIVSRHHV